MALQIEGKRGVIWYHFTDPFLSIKNWDQDMLIVSKS